MVLRRSRFRCTTASMRRSCSTEGEASFPDKSTSVRLSLASMARTKYSPAWAVIPFLESIKTLKDWFSCSASASLMMPFWSLPLAVRLLLSRFRLRRVSFFLSASPIFSAAWTPKLLPSHSNFSSPLFFSSMPASETPSSSMRPLRFRSMERHDVFSERFFASSRRRAGFRSMPQTVMSGALTFFISECRIRSRPPSIFFRCSSSSRRFRSSAFFCCSRRCFSFFTCSSCCLLWASCFSFSFRRFSASSFRFFSNSIFRFRISSVRLVSGRISTGGRKTSVPRTSFSSSSKTASSWIAGLGAAMAKAGARETYAS
mmetsp:Transcript_25397/g.60481  ORF Transcript_25397/g.60481 Transcript_25397/m.60481 type:complete len:315 (+) Transcript_25397:374-1318(+)